MVYRYLHSYRKHAICICAVAWACLARNRRRARARHILLCSCAALTLLGAYVLWERYRIRIRTVTAGLLRRRK